MRFRAAFLIAFCIGSAVSAEVSEEYSEAWTLDEGGITRGPREEPRIALIFTGGDYGEGTEHILDVLASHEIKGNFFVTGAFISQEALQPLLRRMVSEEHYLGPHSHAHPLYASWEDRSQTLVSREFFEEDLRRNIEELREFGALEESETIYFIPPYEWYNAEQVEWARAMDIVLFNFTSGSGSNRDWAPEGHASFVSSEAIYHGVLDYEVRDPEGLNGFLLLLHLGSQREDKMHPWIDPLIDALRARGYEFVRIDEMLPLVPEPDLP